MNWISPLQATAHERPHLRALYEHLVRQLYESSRVPMLALLASLLLLQGVVHDVAAQLPLLRVLIGGLAIISVLRAYLGLRSEAFEQRFPSLRFRFLGFLVASLLTAVLMGTILWTCAFRLDPARFLLLAFWVAGTSSIAVVSMAGSPVAYWAYLVPTLLPLALAGARLHGDHLGTLFSWIIALYGVALAALSWRVHKSLRQSFLLSRQLEDLALRDPLTGLRNRRYLQEFMEEECTRVLRRWLPSEGNPSRRSISIVMVDLDHFKSINDQYGHAAGDAVLVQVAKVLKELVRKPDLVIRWGGEEFVILALDSERVAPPLISVRIHERFASHRFTLPGGERITCTCSVGFGLFPFHPERPEGLEWDQVLRLADEGLYRAKRAGRNRIKGFLPTEAAPDDIVASLIKADLDAAQAESQGLIQEI